MEVSNLNQFFTEFKKYRGDIDNSKKSFYDYVSSGLSIVETNGSGKTIGFFLKLGKEVQKLKEKNAQLVIVIGSLVVVSLVGLIVWFILRKNRK